VILDNLSTWGGFSRRARLPLKAEQGEFRQTSKNWGEIWLPSKLGRIFGHKRPRHNARKIFNEGQDSNPVWRNPAIRFKTTALGELASLSSRGGTFCHPWRNLSFLCLRLQLLLTTRTAPHLIIRAHFSPVNGYSSTNPSLAYPSSKPFWGDAARPTRITRERGRFPRLFQGNGNATDMAWANWQGRSVESHICSG
jgi:hypothetical protein